MGVATVSFASNHDNAHLLRCNARHEARFTDGITLRLSHKIAFIIDTNASLNN
jgi:hypothetical protein